MIRVRTWEYKDGSRHSEEWSNLLNGEWPYSRDCVEVIFKTDIYNPLYNDRNEIVEYFDDKESLENIKSITTHYELEADEIIKKYKDDLDPTAEEMLLGHISRRLVQDKEYKAKGTWEDVLRYAENSGEETQKLEGLILEWRCKLKDQLFAELSFHQPESITDEKIYKEVDEALSEFDNHFNITTQRNGEV